MARMPPIDILHRSVIYSLVGLSAYGVVMSVLIHRDTIKRGKGAVEIMVEREALGLPLTKPKKQELSEGVEQTLAEQAQAIFRNKRSS